MKQYLLLYSIFGVYAAAAAPAAISEPGEEKSKAAGEEKSKVGCPSMQALPKLDAPQIFPPPRLNFSSFGITKIRFVPLFFSFFFHRFWLTGQPPCCNLSGLAGSPKTRKKRGRCGGPPGVC